MATDLEKQQQLRELTLDTALQLAQNKVAPTYAGTFENQLSDIYNKIQNREKFQYDVNADPLYQNYKDKYIQQGKLAMRDTMGKAASLTGGYGSTYGQQVGQQTYDAYLQNLSDVIPELYGKAQEQYQNEGNELKTMYALVGDQRDTEYNKYRDSLSDWNYNQEVARKLEADEYNRQTTAKQQAYANLYALISASGYVPTDAELANAGMTAEAANALRTEFLRQTGQLVVAGGGGGGGGRGGGYTPKGGDDTVTATEVWRAANNYNAAGQYDKAAATVNAAAAKGVITQQQQQAAQQTAAVHAAIRQIQATSGRKPK